MRYNIGPALSFALVIAAVWLVYSLGLPGWFALDDGPNILDNTGIQITSINRESLLQAAFSRHTGIESRALSMISFALNYYAGGLNVYWFKLTNIAIHVLAGVAIFVFSVLLLRAYAATYAEALSRRDVFWICLALTAAWMLHPLNLTSVLYVVQRMTALTALFIALGLAVYLWGRLRMNQGDWGLPLVVCAFLVFMPLAVLNKPNGLLFPLFAVLVEIFIFRGRTFFAYQKHVLRGVFVVFLGLPLIFALFHYGSNPDLITHEYVRREFTLTERLLTQARVIWFYLHMIVLPNNGQMGLFHDDFTLSTGLMQPATTAPAILGIFFLLGIAWWLRQRVPLVSFGILFFFAGHALESTIFGLELVYEHRNYFPMYGILLPIFYYLFHPQAVALKVRRLAGVVFIGLFAASTAGRADTWGDFFLHGMMEVSNHPDSPRANYRMGRVFSVFVESDPENADEHYREAKTYFEKTVELNPNYTGGLFELMLLNAARGKPIDRNWVRELETRLRNSPFSAQSIKSLTTLVDCLRKGNCRSLETDIGVLLQAALGNQSLKGTRRAMLLVWHSYYLSVYRGDNEQALQLAEEAIELSPGVVKFRLHLAALLTRLQQFEDARQVLQRAHEFDVFHSSAREIAQQEARLERALEAARSEPLKRSG